MLAVQPRFGPTLLAQSVAGRRLRFLGHLIFRDINPMSSCWLISPIIPHVYISYQIYQYHIHIYYINVLSDYQRIYRNTNFRQPLHNLRSAELIWVRKTIPPIVLTQIHGRKCDFRIFLYIPSSVPLVAFSSPAAGNGNGGRHSLPSGKRFKY